jgi:hypothetical protein
MAFSWLQPWPAAVPDDVRDAARAPPGGTIQLAGYASLAALEEPRAALRTFECLGGGPAGSAVRSSVYRGSVAGHTVAIKCLAFRDVAAGGSSSRLAEAEATVATTLDHPHIVATYAHELQPGADVASVTRAMALGDGDAPSVGDAGAGPSRRAVTAAAGRMVEHRLVLVQVRILKLW